MTVIHRIDDLLFHLFGIKEPIGSDRLDELKGIIQDFYSYGPFNPKVTVEEDMLIVQIDARGIINEEGDFKKAVSLCERRSFLEAKPLLLDLIQKKSD